MGSNELYNYHCYNASAGTGKTTMLGNIIKNAENNNIDVSKILVLVFENSAKNAMQNKLLSIGINGSPIISTIHSLSYLIIRENIGKKYEIITDSEQYVMVSKILSSLKKNNKKEKFENVFYYLALFSRYSAEGREFGFFNMSSTDMLVFDEYNIYKKRENKIDFGDMLYYGMKLLRIEKIRKSYSNRFKHIIVDEFQDLNFTQFEIVRLLSLNNNNLFVVGDAKQTLYGFSGASPNYIREFTNVFKDAKTYSMKMTYRTPPNILKYANKIALKLGDIEIDTNINHNGDIRLLRFIDQALEAKFIIDEIKDNNMDIHNTAILCRSNSGLLFCQNECIKHRIPFFSKKQTLLQVKHISSLINYLRIIFGEYDKNTLKKIVNIPTRYIPAKVKYCNTIEETYEKADNNNFRDFISHIITLRNRYFGMNDNKSIIKALYEVINTTNIVSYFSYKNNPYDEKIYEDIETLVSFIDSLSGYKELIDICDFIDLNSKNSDGLALLTMHSSKGLEYDNVYMITANDEFIPHSLSEDAEEELRLFYVGVTRSMRKLTISTTSYRNNKEQMLSPFVSHFFNDIKIETINNMSLED